MLLASVPEEEETSPQQQQQPQEKDEVEMMVITIQPPPDDDVTMQHQELRESEHEGGETTSLLLSEHEKKGEEEEEKKRCVEQEQELKYNHHDEELDVLYGQFQIHHAVREQDVYQEAVRVYQEEEAKIAYKFNYKGCYRYEHDPSKINTLKKGRDMKRRGSFFQRLNKKPPQREQQPSSSSHNPHVHALHQNTQSFIANTWQRLRKQTPVTLKPL